MAKLLSNGITLKDAGFWRAWAAVAELVPLHNLPKVETDCLKTEQLLNEIEEAGGFGIVVTRKVKGGVYQKLIDGKTYSPWGHAAFLIGRKIGNKVREQYPDVMRKKDSFRWDVPPGHFVPEIEGIPPKANRFEIVESKAVVEVGNLWTALDDDEQVIVFINPEWTEKQKIAMAREAYSWVGEPYDIFEIGKHGFPWIPNSKRLKACSSLVAKVLSVGDANFVPWCRKYAIDPEMFTPRDVFAYGADKQMTPYCFNCTCVDALQAGYHP